MNAAILGIGPMGIGIARNLAAAGMRPVIWNRTSERLAQLGEADFLIVDSPESAISETVVSVLPDVDQFREITGSRTWSRWSDAGVRRVVVMSTTSPTKIARLEEDLSVHDIALADAPMSGGTRAAAEGSLSIMVGARDADWTVVRDLLTPVASRVVRFGEPGMGTTAKLCNQVVVAGTMTALAESLALAERAGIDRRALIDVFEHGLASSAVLTAKRTRLLNFRYTPSGSAANQLKDLRYVAELAREWHAAVPLTESITPLFEMLVAEGLGSEDTSVVLEALRRAPQTAASAASSITEV
jgi:2-hydroxy-3-oxopropionate reductase